jgi:hypothetical protein
LVGLAGQVEGGAGPAWVTTWFKVRAALVAYDLRVLVPGEVISYQPGMNFGTSGRPSIILMSRRPGAPYVG